MEKSTRARSQTVKDTRASYQTGTRLTPVRRASTAGKAREPHIDISVPSPVFQAMQQLAEKLNVSLNELYTAALTTYVADHGGGGVTEALDRLYATESSELDAVLVNIQAALFAGEAW
jgi:hypothetical protein